MSSASRGGGAARLLRKQKSWSPDTGREAAWARRREAGAGARRGRSWSVTEDDLDELRGCVDLGFGFDAGCGAWRSRLAETFPALDLYYAVHGAGEEAVQLEQEACACGAAASDTPSEESSIGSHMSILSPAEDFILLDRSNGVEVLISSIMRFEYAILIWECNHQLPVRVSPARG